MAIYRNNHVTIFVSMYLSHPLFAFKINSELLAYVVFVSPNISEFIFPHNKQIITFILGLIESFLEPNY